MKNRGEAFSYNADMLVCCAALSVCGIYYNGLSAFLQLVCCVFASVVCEYAAFKTVLKKTFLSDLSAVVLGLSVALMLPANAPLYVGATSCVLTVLAAKLPFGSTTQLPFVPSAVAISLASTLFKKEASTFAASSYGSQLVFNTSENFSVGADLSSMLATGDSPVLNIFGKIDLLSGALPGAMGTTCILALLGCAVYLFLRKKRLLICSAGYLFSVVLFALVFPAVHSGRFSSVMLELCAGSTIFTALLVVNCPFNTPRKPLKAFFCGALGGVLMMLLRRFSPTAHPEAFAVLILNALNLTFFADSKNPKGPFEKEKEGAL